MQSFLNSGGGPLELFVTRCDILEFSVEIALDVKCRPLSISRNLVKHISKPVFSCQVYYITTLCSFGNILDTFYNIDISKIREHKSKMYRRFPAPNDCFVTISYC